MPKMPLRKLPLIATATLVGLWMIAFAATHWPMPNPPQEAWIPHLDKLAHAAIYGVLAIAALVAATAWNVRWSLTLAVTVLLILVGVGTFDELTQLLVAGRSADPLDLAADTLGALVGISLFGIARGVRASQSLAASDSP